MVDGSIADMEDPRWLRLITVGLILAALVIGYSLLTGSFVKSKPASKVTQPSTEVVTASPTPAVLSADTTIYSGTPNPSPASAYEKIVERSQGNIQTLPKTGFPIGLAITFSISGIIIGWSLRKFPH